MSSGIVKAGVGLYQQLQKTDVHPYKNFSLDDMKEMFLDEWRDILNQQAFRMLRDKLTIEEYNQIVEMIQSPDKDSIYMAEQILKFKEDGVQGTEENRE